MSGERAFVSNSRQSVRMFERDWMEALSKVHWSVPLFVFVPLIGLLAWRSLGTEPAAAHFALLFGAGILVWTLLEYVMHRWLFHLAPRSRWGRRLHFIFHGVHHDYPNDAARLVMPPSASVPLALAVYALLLPVPAATRDALFSGLLTGYLAYDMLHYAVHHARLRQPALKWLKRHHMRHHFNEPDRRYGVSTPLWDWVFGTLSGTGRG